VIERETAISIRRTFDAPIDLVYRVFTQADFIAQWWGCEGTVVTVHALDLRPGGDFHFEVLHSDGATDHDCGTYIEVIPCERVVSTTGYATQTLNFEEHDGRTTVTLVVAFESRGAYECALQYGLREGIARSWNVIERIITNALS
jgi:uncharacterized protein YndB with AHSA1/START domain